MLALHSQVGCCALSGHEVLHFAWLAMAAVLCRGQWGAHKVLLGVKWAQAMAEVPCTYAGTKSFSSLMNRGRGDERRQRSSKPLAA